MLYFLLACLSLSLLLYSRRRRPGIPGAFAVPGLPVVGNAPFVLNNPSKVFTQWAHKYRITTFVIHLGSTPVLVANSHHDVHELLNHHLVALCSRPSLYTFHKVVSAVQGLTVGSTPYGPSFKRKKKCISLQLLASHVASNDVAASLDSSSKYVLAKVLADTLKSGTGRSALPDVSFLRHAQCYVLRCALMLTYGRAIDTHGSDQTLADQIIQTENHIIRLRSLISNYQDYVPFLKRPPFLYFFNSEAEFWRNKRDKYMDAFYEEFQQNLQLDDASAKACMLARILSDKSSALAVSARELQSICLTMVSAGLDNLSLTFDHLMGHFSQPEYGYALQEHLYRSLLEQNDGDVLSAWRNSATSMECDYALALIHEALRFFSVLPLNLPRSTIKPFKFKGMMVPKDTIVILNAYAANHDPATFNEPFKFDPGRWLDDNGKILAPSKINHFTFGSGSRYCSGSHLSIKEMYVMLCRTTLLFRVRRPTDTAFLMELDPFKANSCPRATSFEPKEFRVWLQPRLGAQIFQLHREVLS